MNEEAMNQALNAIYEEAEKLLSMELIPDVRERIELILSIARYKFDNRHNKGN